MTAAHDAITATESEVDKLRKSLARGSRQVSKDAERDIIKANVTTWFHTRRPIVVAALNEGTLSDIDGIYRELHGLASKSALRTRYQTTLKGLKKALSELAREKAVELSKPMVTGASDIPPVFSSITVDAEMQRILSSRWNECAGCVEKGFPLAGIVMIGGLLEAVLLARVNLLTDQAPVFKASAAPKDKKSGNPLPLKDWGLRDFIDVACELKWITETHKDVSVILRDYRNYIHPHKEYQHKKRIEPSDAGVLWDVGKTMMRQLLKIS